MALQIFDRIKERVQTGAGTGNLTLLGAPTGFKTFSSRLSVSDTTYYCIEGPNGAFEIGVGTLSSSTTLVRTTVLRSSNSDGAISIGASGQYFVFISYIADKAVYRNTANEVVVPSEGFRFSDNTTQTTSPIAAIALKADIASPTFTGVPSGPTATGGTSTTQLATTAFVSSAIATVDLTPYALLPDILPVAGTLLSYGGSRQLAAGGTVSHSGSMYIGGNVCVLNTSKIGWQANSVTPTDAYFVRNAVSSVGVKGASGIDGTLTCGDLTASDVVSCPQINGVGTGYSVGVFGPSADLSSSYRNLDINAPSGLPVLQFKTNGTLRSQHYWESNVFNIYSAGNHALTSSSATQMLGFGGLMVGTPALKRVLNTLQVRLGDDSNFADLYTGAIIASGAITTNTISTTATSLRFDSTTSTDYWRLDHSIPGYSGALQLLSSAGTPRLTLIGRTDMQALHFENTSGSAFVGNGLVSSGSGVRNGFNFAGYAIGGGVTLIASNNSGVMDPILRWGGTTSSYPAIKRSGTTTAFRLADDSADGPISCGAITASGNVVSTNTLGGGAYTTSINVNNPSLAAAPGIQAYYSGDERGRIRFAVGSGADLFIQPGTSGAVKLLTIPGADAALTCGAIIASGVIIAPLGMIASANNLGGVQVSATSFIPATGNGFGYNDNACDLGIAASRWRDLRIGRDAYIGGAITASGQIIGQGTSASTPLITLQRTGAASNASLFQVIPDNTYDTAGFIGIAHRIWFEAYGGSTWISSVQSSGYRQWSIAAGSQLTFNDSTYLGWDSTKTYGVGSADVRLYPGGAGILQRRNGLNPQTDQLFSTYTSSTSFACLDQRANAGGTAYEISSFKGSAGGSNLPINIGHRDAAGTFTQSISISTGNVVTIGSPSTCTLTWSTQGVTSSRAFIAAATDLFYWNGRSVMSSPADGTIKLSNYNGDNFTALCLGGSTSSFPAIKRNAAAINLRLADDSADAALTCGTFTASGNLTLSDTNLITGTTTGTIIATANSQKLGFWGATPIVQPTTAVAAATLVSNGGTTLTDTDSFDGYTLKQIVKALRIAGLLA